MALAYALNDKRTHTKRTHQHSNSVRPSVCPSVRLSRFGTVSKRLSISSHFLQLLVAQSFWFSNTVHLCEIPTVSPSPTGVLNTGGVYKFCDFRQIPGYMWETIQDRGIITTER